MVADVSPAAAGVLLFAKETNKIAVVIEYTLLPVSGHFRQSTIITHLITPREPKSLLCRYAKGGLVVSTVYGGAYMKHNIDNPVRLLLHPDTSAVTCAKMW